MCFHLQRPTESVMPMIRMLLLLCVLLVAAATVCTTYVNEDLFLSFAAGRDIAQGLIAAPDHWSFTVSGKVWINQAWLSHLVLYASHSQFGPAGPVLVKIGVLLGCIALVFLRCRRLGASIEVSLFAIFMGTLASGPFLGIRPENFGVFFFILFTVLLTDTRSSRVARRVGIPLVLVVWSNVHGSFMLGLALLGMQAALGTVRTIFGISWGIQRESSWADVAEGWTLALASIAGIAVLNPYGTANLLMPFRQVGTEVITGHSADWLPLLKLHLADATGFPALGGYAYPAFLFLFGMALVALLTLEFKNHGYEGPSGFRYRPDLILEGIIVSATGLLAFRFARLGLFAGFSLAPLFAFVLQRLQVRLSAFKTLQPRISQFATIAAFILTIGMGWVFYRGGILPYMPGNPTRPPRTVARELMSFDAYSPHLASFMKENAILGRVFSGWELSSFLMDRIPEIRLFMDCRDQSFYPANVVTDYFIILGIMTPKNADPMSLLDRYGVSTVALATTPIDFELAMKLLKTRTWACVYADAWSLVLVRTDSERFRGMGGTLEGLWFPDSDTKILSDAMSSYFLENRIRPDVLESLKRLVMRDPRPDVYSLICLGMENGSGEACFRKETVDFLLSEATRLSKSDPGGTLQQGQVLESLVRIYEILEDNAGRCGDRHRFPEYRAARMFFQDKYQALVGRYTGRIF